MNGVGTQGEWGGGGGVSEIKIHCDDGEVHLHSHPDVSSFKAAGTRHINS